MDISLHKKSPVEATITLQVHEADYQPRLEKRIREHGKKAHIKGFRPGHTPLSLIKQLHGRTILAEILHTLLAESLANYLEKQDFITLGEPLLENDPTEEDDWNQQREFTFRYNIGLVEDFALDLSKQLQVKAHQVEQVADKSLDEAIEQLRKKHGVMRPVAKSELGDTLQGEFSHPQDQHELKTRFSTAGLIAVEEQKLLTDLQVQDVVTVDIKALSQQGIEFADITAQRLAEMLQLGDHWEFSVEQIYRPIPAALDKDFFDEVLGQDVATDGAAFRSKLQEQIIHKKQQEAELLLIDAIRNTLLEQTNIRLPDEFLKRWLQKKEPTITNEELASHYQQYAQALKWQLILKKITQEHNLQVAAEEVIEETKQLLQTSHNVPAEIAEQLAHNFLQAEQGNNYQYIYEVLLARKLINLIKDKITIIAQPISAEALDKLIQKTD